MKVISFLFVIGTLIVSLKVFSNSDTTPNTNENRSENPVSAPGLLLTDESPLVSPGEAEQKSQPDESTTVEINNEAEEEPRPNNDSGFEDIVESNEETQQEELLEKKQVEQAQEEEIPLIEANVEEPQRPSINTGEYKKIDSRRNTTVIVEPSTAVRLDYVHKKTQFIPYSERRLKWGQFVGASVGQAKFNDFGSNFLNDTFDNIYGGDKNPGAEVHFNFKRNFDAFSVGIELNLGNAKKNSDKELIETSLETSFWKIGLQLAVDNIFRLHSYVVPYVTGGVYQILYKEQLEGVSNNGWTQVSFYGSAGLMFSIDWLDPISSKAAYFESGVENTFLFIEGTYFMASEAERDPDFTGVDAKAGIKVEL